VVVLLDPFPDAELVMMDLVRGLATVVTATPATITPPLIRVERVGGADDGITDRPRIRAVCYGATRPLAWALARNVTALVGASGGQLVTGPNTVAEYPGGVLIDLARTATAPKQVPEQGRSSREVETIYEIHLRRPWW
jgi:hypothetical protein